MTKTTIDGLRVRESKPKQPKSLEQTSNSHVAKLSSSRRSATQSRRTSSIKSVKNTAGDFLDPVKTFNFDSEAISPDTETTNDADWSDLLNTIEQTPADEQLALPSRLADNSGENFLSAWNDEDKTDFLNTAITKSELDDDEETDEPTPKRSHRRYKPRKKHHFGRIFAISSICLLLIGGGILYKWGDELIMRLTGGNSGLWDAIHSMVSDEVPFQTDENGRTNILVFGTEGYNMNGDTAYGAHDGAQLTDSIMVISLDQNTKDVALLSLPRDLKVRSACSAGKINEVFWCHNQDGTKEEAGAQALMKQVSEVLGIDFQYYAHINWASLIDIIDTIGGITVTLDENIADYNYTGAVAQAGVPMEVNGEQALGLARARHGTVGGDFTRGNTQQKIVEGIVNKVLQNGIGISGALDLLNILGDNLRSNFSTDNIKAGLRVLSGFNMANIRQVPLVNYDTNTFYMTTDTINNVSYVVPAAGVNNYSDIQRYVAEMFSSNPTVRENARIVVLNASGQYGVAGAERERLQSDDYDVVSIGDAELGVCPESYCVYAVNENFPNTSSTLAERYGVSVRNITELPEGITPGETDFIIILGFRGDEV